MTYSFFCNIQFMYEYCRIENMRDSVCFQCYRFIFPSCQFRATFLPKFVQFPQSPTFIKKFLTTFLLHNHVQIFHQNSILVAETRIYTKPLTPNRRLPPSSACSVVSKEINQRSGPIIYCETLMVHRLKKTSVTVSSSQICLKCDIRMFTLWN